MFDLNAKKRIFISLAAAFVITIWLVFSFDDFSKVQFKKPETILKPVHVEVDHGRPKKAIDYEEMRKEVCDNSWEDEYTKIHKHIIETKQNRFIIYQGGKGGWGNHVGHMLATFQIAVVTRRAYIDVCKIPGPTDKYLKPRNIQWNYKLNRTGLTVGRGFRFTKETIKDHTDRKLFEKVLTHAVEYEPRFYQLRQDIVPAILRFKNKTFSKVHQLQGCCFYYLFKKSDLLQRQLEAWKKELGFLDNIVLGLHIRHGDYVFNANFAWDTRFKNGTKEYDIIFACAEQIERKIADKFKTKKIIWYLATDRSALRGHARNKYGNKVRYTTGPIEHVGYPKKGFEDAGQLTAFLDFFLLQESDYRFYSTLSGFHLAVDFITFGTENAGEINWKNGKNECVIPKSLKD